MLEAMVDNLFPHLTAKEAEALLFPVAPKLVQQAQNECETLAVICLQEPEGSTCSEVQGYKLVHYKNKIYVPLILTRPVAKRHHKILVHPGLPD